MLVQHRHVLADGGEHAAHLDRGGRRATVGRRADRAARRANAIEDAQLGHRVVGLVAEHEAPLHVHTWGHPLDHVRLQAALPQQRCERQTNQPSPAITILIARRVPRATGVIAEDVSCWACRIAPTQA